MKKNISFHENNLKPTINKTANCADFKQKTPLQLSCKGVFSFIKCDNQFRILVQSRSALHGFQLAAGTSSEVLNPNYQYHLHPS